MRRRTGTTGDEIGVEETEVGIDDGLGERRAISDDGAGESNKNFRSGVSRTARVTESNNVVVLDAKSCDDEPIGSEAVDEDANSTFFNGSETVDASAVTVVVSHEKIASGDIGGGNFRFGVVDIEKIVGDDESSGVDFVGTDDARDSSTGDVATADAVTVAIIAAEEGETTGVDSLSSTDRTGGTTFENILDKSNSE